MGRESLGESSVSALFGRHSDLTHNNVSDYGFFPSCTPAVTSTHLRPLRFKVKSKHGTNFLSISNPYYCERKRKHRYTLSVTTPSIGFDNRLVLKRDECDKCLILSLSEDGKVDARLSDLSNDSSILANMDVALKFDAIIGIYELPIGPFLAVVSDFRTAFKHPGLLNLRQVMEVTLWPLSSTPVASYIEGRENHHESIETGIDGALPTLKMKSYPNCIDQQGGDVELLRSAFSSHQLYYEFPEGDFHWPDATSSVQRRILKTEVHSVLPGWRGADR